MTSSLRQRFPVERTGAQTAPLSSEQEQLYYHSFFLRRNPIYNEVVAVTKTGPFDVGAMQSALSELVTRHEMWRTTFRHDGLEPYQVVGPVPTYELSMHDISALSPAARRQAAMAIAVDKALRPFDLERGPLVRPWLVKVSDDEHRLYLALHHLVFDGVSLYRIVLPELAALYDAAVAGVPADLPEPPVQYVDYVHWQRSGVLDEEVSRHLPYWRARLAGAPACLELPTARVRSAEARHHGFMIGFVVAGERVEALRELAHASGATLFHVLGAAFAVLLSRVSGDEEVVFATVADLRRRREFESMVGYCLTPMPLRVHVGDRWPSVDLVRDVRDEMLDGMTHLLPFERLVRELNRPRVQGADPIFQAMLVLEPPTPDVHPQWRLHPHDAEIGTGIGHAKTDVHLELDERPEGHLSARLILNRDLFDEEQGRQLVSEWEAVLADLSSMAMPTT